MKKEKEEFSFIQELAALTFIVIFCTALALDLSPLLDPFTLRAFGIFIIVWYALCTLWNVFLRRAE